MSMVKQNLRNGVLSNSTANNLWKPQAHRMSFLICQIRDLIRTMTQPCYPPHIGVNQGAF